MPNIVAFDTETRGLKWFDESEQAFLASWADANGEHVADLSRSDDTSRFLDAISNADILVCHNASFDVHQVRESTGFDALQCGVPVFDTDLISRVLHPEGQRKGQRGGHGLKNLAKVYLSQDAGDAEQAIMDMAKQIGVKLKSTGGYYDVWRAYPREMEHYAKMDARFTHDLFRLFSDELKSNEQAAEIVRLEHEVMPIMIRAEQRGVALDQPVVKKLKKQYTKELRAVYASLEKQLGSTALGDPDEEDSKGSDDALRDALLSQGIPLHRKTDTGEIATNQFALQEFEKKFPVISELFEYRRLRKFLKTYIGAMDGRDTVHPNFRQIGAWTGRMSCASPNMQNLPRGKEVRAMLVPRPGHSFVVCDYDSIEVRLLAYYLNDPGYRELAAHHDPHAWMASHIHGGVTEDFLKGGPNDELRSEAKNTLFAIVYGAGARRISDMNNMPPGPPLGAGAWMVKNGYAKVGDPSYQPARDLINTIKKSLPGYLRLAGRNGRVPSKIERDGYVTTLFGRKQMVNRDKAYVGLNALIQGSAADIMKAGLVLVDNVIEDLGGHVLMVVHDEVVVEVPTANAEECLRRTKDALVLAHDLNPPLAVTGSIVHTNYGEAK